MARLTCEAKLAYYPTDPNTLRKVIDRCLRFSANGKKRYVLDPCCGTGEALNIFREFSNDSVLYGIELDEGRAKEASDRLDRVLNADAIYNVRKSNDWTSVLFLNPPYGQTSDGDRLETEFIERYARCVIKGGVMVLVINPSSADDKTAKALINYGYKPIVSVYDPNSEDYKRYTQFFVVLQRIDRRFRTDPYGFMRTAFNPVSIDKVIQTEAIEVPSIASQAIRQIEAKPIEVPLGGQTKRAEPIEALARSIEYSSINVQAIRRLEQIEVPSGIAPSLFKEIELPEWKLEELLSKSGLLKRFNALTATAESAVVSVEIPNEGQAAVLVASGALGGKTIGDWLLKGQVVKSSKETTEYDEETGETTGVRTRDEYKTIVYGLNVRTLEFARFE
jgi:predicted RNA methylase